MTPEGLIIETVFNVVDKKKVTVPFVLNQTQRRLDDEMTLRNIVPKARQKGVSRFVLARFTAACLSQENTSAVIISHEADATQRLLAQCHFFLERLRGPKPTTRRQSVSMITFPKTNSVLYIGTAGAKKFGRGDTISHLHCSEYAYWPDGPTLLGGILQSTTADAEVWIESTGNGKGNDYHRRCVRAREGQSDFTCHFISWVEDEEYTAKITPEEEVYVLDHLVEEWDEPFIVANGASARHVVWRRNKLEEIDYDLDMFRQEYPTTFDECFQTKDSGVFPRAKIYKVSGWRNMGNSLWGLDSHPKANSHYVIGADVGGGVRRDNSVAEVVAIGEFEQVAEYASNVVDPSVFGEKLAEVGRQYNHAYIVCENNNHGLTTLDVLRKSGYPLSRIYVQARGKGEFANSALMRLGVRTTERTKPFMIGVLKKMMNDGLLLHSELLGNELSTYVEDENGRMGAMEGSNDDRVMAMACLAYVFERAEIMLAAGRVVVQTPQEDPFSLENILLGAGAGRDNLPMAQNVAGGLILDGKGLLLPASFVEELEM